MPPRAIRASTAYRPSTSRPIRGSGPATIPPAYGCPTENSRNAAGAGAGATGTGACPDGDDAGGAGHGRRRRHLSREPPAQGEDVGDVPAGGGEQPMRTHRGQPLVVRGDGRLLRLAGTQRGEDGDPGDDVVARVEQVQVAPDEGGRPAPGRRHDLHDTDRVRARYLLLVEAGLLDGDRDRQRRVDPEALRGPADEALDLAGVRRGPDGDGGTVRVGRLPHRRPQVLPADR